MNEEPDNRIIKLEPLEPKEVPNTVDEPTYTGLKPRRKPTMKSKKQVEHLAKARESRLQKVKVKNFKTKVLKVLDLNQPTCVNELVELMTDKDDLRVTPASQPSIVDKDVSTKSDVGPGNITYNVGVPTKSYMDNFMEPSINNISLCSSGINTVQQTPSGFRAIEGYDLFL